MEENLWEIYCLLADIKKNIDIAQSKICKLCPKLDKEKEFKATQRLSSLSPEDYD